jgi:pimeloyl-ACP methyl ester carboxylesterase
VTSIGAIGPDVVLLHGVGLDPRLFDPVLSMIPNASAPFRHRYGHDRAGGARAAMASVEADAAELLDTVAAGRSDRPLVVVGVSGGATLALAMAAIGRSGLAGVIAHEPLVGPLAPELHALVVAAAAELAGGAGSIADRAAAFVRRLVGEATWATLPPEARRFVGEHAAEVHAEVPLFAGYAPTVDDLAAIVPPLVVSTGERSHARRHQAAAALAALSPATQLVVRGAGHLVHWEQPVAFASMVNEQISQWAVAA